MAAFVYYEIQKMFQEANREISKELKLIKIYSKMAGSSCLQRLSLIMTFDLKTGNKKQSLKSEPVKKLIDLNYFIKVGSDKQDWATYTGQYFQLRLQTIEA